MARQVQPPSSGKSASVIALLYNSWLAMYSRWKTVALFATADQAMGAAKLLEEAKIQHRLLRSPNELAIHVAPEAPAAAPHNLILQVESDNRERAAGVLGIDEFPEEESGP